MADSNTPNYKDFEWFEFNLINKLNKLNEEWKKSSNLPSFLLSTVVSVIITYYLQSFITSKSFILQKLKFLIVPVIFLIIYYLAQKVMEIYKKRTTNSSVKSCKEKVKDFDKCVYNKLMLCNAFIDKYHDIKRNEIKCYYYNEIQYYFSEALKIVVDIVNNFYYKVIDGIKNTENIIDRKISIYRLEVSIKIFYYIGLFLIEETQEICENLEEQSKLHFNNDIKSLIANYNTLINKLISLGLNYKKYELLQY